MKTSIIRGQVAYCGKRAGTVYIVYIALFGPEPGLPAFQTHRQGPGPYEFHDVTPGRYFPQACISDQPCAGDAPPISFADGQFDIGRPLMVGDGQVIDQVDMVLEDKPRESMSMHQGGQRVEFPAPA